MKRYSITSIDFYNMTLSMQGLIILLVCAFVFYIGYSWDLDPLIRQYSASVQHEQDLKQQVAVIIQKEISLAHYISQDKKLNEALVEWKQRLVTHPELEEALNEILKLGSNNQLQLSSFSPGEEIKDGAFFKLPIKLVVLGTYNQIAYFFNQIADMKKIISIGDFTLSSESTDKKTSAMPNESNLLTAEVELDAYHFDETKPNEKKKK